MAATPEPARYDGPYEVRETEVQDLIRRAQDHALGLSFLREGAQDAVAAMFGVHAFLVDAARVRLQGGPA